MPDSEPVLHHPQESGQSARARTLLDLLRWQAEHQPNRQAYTFVSDDGGEATLTVGTLDLRARAIAARLQQVAKPGDRVLLVYPPGLDFISAFFGCMYAGLLAVPATYPKPRRPMPRLAAISADCGAAALMTTSQMMETLELSHSLPALESLAWLASDTLSDEAAVDWRRPSLTADDLAFLQYTSGSTSDPKGVMVSHGNLLHNLEMIRQGFDIEGIHVGATDRIGVFWLPAYHDMGLIGGILSPLYEAERTVLMSPAAFLQRPRNWLQMMTDLRATVSGAPNFAYELCVKKIPPEQRAGLDLSNWRLAFCGAEPIQAETLRRFTEAFAPCGFRDESFYPCYGLAEATLLASGGRGPARLTVVSVDREALNDHRVVRADDGAATHRLSEKRSSASGRGAGREGNVRKSESAEANSPHPNPLPEGEGTSLDGSLPSSHVQPLVACGQALVDQVIAIVDPVTRTRLGPYGVGEIWVAGPSVAKGYWNRPEETAATFAAQIADEGPRLWLRTGDLGFMSDGQLCVTGRLKDVIIIRGRNHYPQDIEATARTAHVALDGFEGAAFSVDIEGEERLVVVHEVSRQYKPESLSEVLARIRRQIAIEHELDVYGITLIRQASLPRTTSGKVQRGLCRAQYLQRELKVVVEHVWAAAPTDTAAGEGAALIESPHAGVAASGNGKPLRNGNGHRTCGTKPPPFTAPGRVLTASELDHLAEMIETWLVQWLIERVGVAAADIDRDRPFAEYGLDSMAAVELSQQLEDWLHLRLTPVVAWNYPTPATLAGYLARQAGGVVEAVDVSAPAGGDSIHDNEFDRLLAEIENLSENEAQAALDQRQI